MKLFEWIGSSSARILGIEVFDSDGRHPWFQSSLYFLHRRLVEFQHWRFWFGQRFVTRPHIIDTKLDPHDFHEVDELMFHACFRILGSYVEDQLGRPTEKDHERAVKSQYPYEITIHRGYRVHNDRYDPEGIDLWLWYRDELPEVKRRYDDLVHMIHAGKTIRIGDAPDTSTPEQIMMRTVGRMLMKEEFGDDSRHAIAKLEDEKLTKLIAIRRYLSL